jgi:hypothetical protein
VQITLLHALPLAGLPVRLWMATCAVLPWAVRGRFPINRFSDNYAKPGVGSSSTLHRVLYRLKKYQYILYKHCLLHGLNVSIAMSGIDLSARLTFDCIGSA